MKKTALIVFLLLVITACTAEDYPQAVEVHVPETVQVEQDNLAIENEPTPTVEVDRESIPTDTSAPTVNIESPLPSSDSAGLDCIGAEPHEIGLGIAESFPETTYEEVMAWFCNGAEFEDILVALQTEEITDFPAGEMLFMLADDWTWDEIWQVIGLTE